MNKKHLIIACLLALTVLLSTYQLAFAHTPITVGDYTIEIGWVSEPPITGQYTVNLGGKLGSTEVKADVQPEEVQPSDTLAFPNNSSAEENAGLETNSWVSWLALVAGLGVIVGTS